MAEPNARESDYDICIRACMNRGMTFDQAQEFVGWHGTNRILGKETTETGHIKGLSEMFRKEERLKGEMEFHIRTTDGNNVS